MVLEHRFSFIGVHFYVADGHSRRVLVCVFRGVGGLDPDRASSDGLVADDSVAIAVSTLGGAVLGATIAVRHGLLADLTAKLVADIDFGAHVISVP